MHSQVGGVGLIVIGQHRSAKVFIRNCPAARTDSYSGKFAWTDTDHPDTGTSNSETRLEEVAWAPRRQSPPSVSLWAPFWALLLCSHALPSPSADPHSLPASSPGPAPHHRLGRQEPEMIKDLVTFQSRELCCHICQRGDMTDELQQRGQIQHPHPSFSPSQ